MFLVLFSLMANLSGSENLAHSDSSFELSKHQEIQELEEKVTEVCEKIKELLKDKNKLRETIKGYKDYHDPECISACRKKVRDSLIQHYRKYKSWMEDYKGEKDRLLSELAKFHASWSN